MKIEEAGGIRMTDIEKILEELAEKIEIVKIPNEVLKKRVRKIYKDLLLAGKSVVSDQKSSELAKKSAFAFSRTLLLSLKQYIDVSPNFDEAKGLITVNEETLEMYYRGLQQQAGKLEMLSDFLLTGIGKTSILMKTSENNFKLSLMFESEEVDGTADLESTLRIALEESEIDSEEIEAFFEWKKQEIEELKTSKWIGNIPHSGKVSQILVENFMQELCRHGQKVFGENFRFESVNSTETRIVNKAGETFVLTYQDDGFHLNEIGEAKMTSFEQFNGDVQQRLEMFSKFISFVYQQSFIEIPETSIALEMPGKRRLEELEQQEIIERFKGFPYNLDDLALVGDQREYLGNLAEQLKGFFAGEGHKPSLALICGQSGTGKSTIAKALMNTVKNIPCYILKDYRGNNWNSYLQKLKEFFFYLKIGKELVFVEDLEKFLGRDPVKKEELEHLLNSETEKIATLPYSYLIAVTEHPENIISKSLTAGGHRFELTELEKISDPEDVKEMIVKILRMIDAGLNQRPQSSTEEVEAKYQIDYEEIANYTVEKEGLVPGQIRRILLKCLKDTTVDTEEFKSEVDSFIEQKARIDNQRSTARIEELEDMVLALQTEMQKLAQEKIVMKESVSREEIEILQEKATNLQESLTMLQVLQKTSENKRTELIAELEKRLEASENNTEENTEKIAEIKEKVAENSEVREVIKRIKEAIIGGE
jgi:ABC-type dipeptide/oligopeptide/nickel transport system ATPase component